MPRYIDADTLTVAVYDAFDGIPEIHDRGIVISEKVSRLIFAQKTADVVERKVGKWSEVGGVFMCSKCEKCYPYATDYCPKCGAEMKGEEE